MSRFLDEFEGMSFADLCEAGSTDMPPANPAGASSKSSKRQTETAELVRALKQQREERQYEDEEQAELDKEWAEYEAVQAKKAAEQAAEQQAMMEKAAFEAGQAAAAAEAAEAAATAKAAQESAARLATAPWRQPAQAASNAAATDGAVRLSESEQDEVKQKALLLYRTAEKVIKGASDRNSAVPGNNDNASHAYIVAEAAVAEQGNIKWRERGPRGPDKPQEWRGQQWRESSQRYANRGGKNSEFWANHFREKRIRDNRKASQAAGSGQATGISSSSSAGSGQAPGTASSRAGSGKAAGKNAGSGNSSLHFRFHSLAFLDFCRRFVCTSLALGVKFKVFSGLLIFCVCVSLCLRLVYSFTKSAV